MQHATDRRPMTGQRLADRYELVARVGSGGMAEVWEGIDHNLGRRVAIKILHGHLAADPNVLTRFRSEAQAAARLTHPGIVGIYDTVTTDSTDAIIMELVAGRDLRTILDERPTLAAPDAVEVGVQLASALGHAHQNGIVHRDVKPANILVRPDRRVKLSDFGIAKALDQVGHTESGSLVGTVKYLAPEQIEGHGVDGRTDLYGLTTVLYEMLCGEVPFSATDLMGAMDRLRRDAPSARRIRPDIPPALDAFLRVGLSRDPDDRYPDAATWSASLTEAIRGNVPAEQEQPRVPPPVVDLTTVDPGPVSIPIRAAPTPPISASPEVTSTPQPSIRRRDSKPQGHPDSTASPTPAKFVKAKRRSLRWVGPFLALVLMLAAIATIYLLLKPAGDSVIDSFETSTSNGDPPSVNPSQNDEDRLAPALADGTGEADQQASSTSTSTTATSTTLPPFSNGRRTSLFDPLGDGDEHNAASDRPFDGDPATFWSTHRYRTRSFGQIKDGVGVVVEFEEPQPLDKLRILANRTDWAVDIYEADAPSAVLAGWGEPFGEFSELGEESELDLPDISVTSLLVWVTDLGIAIDMTSDEYDEQVDSGAIEQQLKIFEIELIG